MDLEGSGMDRETSGTGLDRGATDLLEGVESRMITTARLRTHVITSGPQDGVPIVMVHGNLTSCRFFEHLMPSAPDGYRLIAPDMRSFGDSQPLAIDATRGLDDWADDVAALVDALDISGAVHLVGWSTGGAAIAAYAQRRPAASLTFIDPVSPYGYGGVRTDGTPCQPDYAGSGGGTGSPDFRERIEQHDTSDDSPFSPRTVMNTSYWRTSHREPPEREDLLVGEILKAVTGVDGYPGDSVPSDNWPGVAPGTRGILNALSPKYCNWTGIVDLSPKPPILWTHGGVDVVIADGAAWEIGKLGQLGAVPGWPGEEVFPPQPMVSQIRAVLERYRDAGGRVETEVFADSGHAPHIDAAERWSRLFFDFIESVARDAA